jgi:integrase/recombinase XerC
LAESTIGNARTILRAFERHLADVAADASFADVSKADIEGWLDVLDVSPQTRRGYINTLAGFYRYLCEEEVVVGDPTRGVARPRRRHYQPRPIAADDLALALSRADRLMRLVLSLAAYAGLRAQEIARLRVGDVMLERTPPTLLVSHEAAKGGRERLVPISARLQAALHAYGLPRSGRVVIGYSDKPLSPTAVSKLASDHFAALRIRATLHQCRHFFGTELWRATKDARLCQDLLGHADLSSTMVYTAWDRADAVAGVASIGVARA